MNKVKIQGYCLCCSFPLVLWILMVIIKVYGIVVFAGCFFLFGTILTLLAGKLSELSRSTKSKEKGN
jgi:hypothetical protein